MPKTQEEKTKDKAKRRNIEDVIRDEIYGAAIKNGERNEDGKQIFSLYTKDVRKISKKIAKRWLIGPR